MTYKFEKTFEETFSLYIEADTLEDAIKQANDAPYDEWENDDGGEKFLTSARCCVYDNDEDPDEYTEVEWWPE